MLVLGPYASPDILSNCVMYIHHTYAQRNWTRDSEARYKVPIYSQSNQWDLQAGSTPKVVHHPPLLGRNSNEGSIPCLGSHRAPSAILQGGKIDPCEVYKDAKTLYRSLLISLEIDTFSRTYIGTSYSI